MRKKICENSKRIMDYVIKNSSEKPEKNKLYSSDIPSKYYVEFGLVDEKTCVSLSVYDHQNRHGLSDGKDVVPSSRLHITFSKENCFSLEYSGRLNGRLEEMYFSNGKGHTLRKSINIIERWLHPDRTKRFQKGYEDTLSNIEGIITQNNDYGDSRI